MAYHGVGAPPPTKKPQTPPHPTASASLQSPKRLETASLMTETSQRRSAVRATPGQPNSWSHYSKYGNLALVFAICSFVEATSSFDFRRRSSSRRTAFFALARLSLSKSSLSCRRESASSNFLNSRSKSSREMRAADEGERERSRGASPLELAETDSASQGAAVA